MRNNMGHEFRHPDYYKELKRLNKEEEKEQDELDKALDNEEEKEDKE